MNREFFLKFINNLLSLKAWEDISNIIYLDKNNNFVSYEFFSLSNYFNTMQDYLEMKSVMKDDLLWFTLEAYNNLNFYVDWLPDRILDLSIPQAYLFLEEIKDVLESNIFDEQIEDELKKIYFKIK